MALHLIPDREDRHAPTAQCNCRPTLVRTLRPDGTLRWAYQHYDDGDLAYEPAAAPDIWGLDGAVKAAS